MTSTSPVFNSSSFAADTVAAYGDDAHLLQPLHGIDSAPDRVIGTQDLDAVQVMAVGSPEVDVAHAVKKRAYSGVVAGACLFEQMVDIGGAFTERGQRMPGQHDAGFDRVRNDLVGAALQQVFEVAVVTGADDQWNVGAQLPDLPANIFGRLDLGE